MKDKWDTRIYLELYAGAGHSRIRQFEIIVGSPLLALNVKDPFDKYVFCEDDSEKARGIEVPSRADASDKELLTSTR